MRISIVTPSYNAEKYILGNLENIFSQKGKFGIEHIIVDGGSKDSTVSIIKQFEKDVSTGKRKPHCSSYKLTWVSEKDNGMYDAILKGFAISSGEIMSWLNADDMYQEGALGKVIEYFEKNEKVLWLKGITDYIEKDGSITRGRFNKYFRSMIRKGTYGTVSRFIQQDSVFWKRELWESIERDEIKTYKLAGDFRLWQLFAEKTKLYSIPVPVSFFRKRAGQLSSNMEEYRLEMSRTVKLSLLEQSMYKFLSKVENFIVLFCDTFLCKNYR